jgi:hypothetical protein
MLIQSCPVRVVMLNGTSNFDDEGMNEGLRIRSIFGNRDSSLWTVMVLQMLG